MKRMLYVIMFLLIVFSLSACNSDDDTRTVVETEWIYDFIGIKSIEVNGELFTTFCKHEKDDDTGLWITPGTARWYTDSDGTKYISSAFGSCEVFYNKTMYHGFDLLEDNILNVEELELLQFPFSEELE